MSEHPARSQALLTRWLGVGLASVIAVVTLGLALTGRLTMYISPDTVWFAAVAAALLLIGAVWTCTLPLGAESDHGHEHGHDHGGGRRGRRVAAAVGTGAAAVIASGFVVAAIALPPASLSAELAMSRAGEQRVLFAGADEVRLGVADTASFGVGEWSSVFATATRPETFDGASVTLTGFVTPAKGGELGLTRMVITHCVIDAQPASVPVSASASEFATGQWIEVTGTVRAGKDGSLRIEPTSMKRIAEPKDPYEY
ncbi:TIGR03943 family protein [Microbacterium sp.]|uniref:TIGR03943 family putative permease subunit n=1 Tax=Microbacterium sp. TaxID=51671 RepID=UPI00333E3BCC